METALAALGEDDLQRYQGDLERAGQFKLGDHIVTSAMVEIKPQQKRLTGRCLQATKSRYPTAPHIPTKRQAPVITSVLMQRIVLHLYHGANGTLTLQLRA